MSTNYDDTRCGLCRRQLTVMKRCTRCKLVLYCSRDCQMGHWQEHKLVCGNKGDPPDTIVKKTFTMNFEQTYKNNDNSIFHDEEDNKELGNKIEVHHPPLVDFSKATSKQKEDNNLQQPEGNFYLHHGKFFTDIPEIDDQLSMSSITVKCHKEKHKLDIQNSWTGEEIFKYLSFSLKIPFEKIKLIHKGKVLGQENVSETIQNKAVYQVIGEVAESEEGIDQRDISVMMKQMGIERNQAIKVLRDKGDLIDALLD